MNIMRPNSDAMQHQILIEMHLFLLTEKMPFRHGAGGARLGDKDRAGLGLAGLGELLDTTSGKIKTLTTTTATPNRSQQKTKMCPDEEPKTAA
jgi:hypothetical protein